MHSKRNRHTGRVNAAKRRILETGRHWQTSDLCMYRVAPQGRQVMSGWRTPGQVVRC